jgi:hypothetical protein
MEVDSMESLPLQVIMLAQHLQGSGHPSGHLNVKPTQGWTFMPKERCVITCYLYYTCM